MGVMMIVMLYTSRVILNILGVDDYGTWNVIASFVVSFSFISAPLVTATQRFLNFDMGNGGKNLNAIFSTSFQLFMVIDVLLLIAFETGGLWFLNNKMNFDGERMTAINWVYQLSIISLFLKFIRLPYESAIIAHERMSFYAKICLVEAFMLLAIVYVLSIFPALDRLVFYGVLTVIVQLMITTGYKVFCNRNFACTCIKWKCNPDLIKEIGSFSGWNLLVSLSAMTASSGLNILLNMFFGVVINAAFSITTQIGSAVNQFVCNFQRAVNPQIVKNYAQGNYERLHFLLFNTSKYSFLLMFLIVFPLFMNIDYGLKLWLGDEVPEITSLFCRIFMVYLLIMSSASVFDTAILATGDIRNYQIVLSAVVFLNIVLSYLFFKYHSILPQATLWIKAAVEVLIFSVRIVFLKKHINLSLLRFIQKVIFPIFIITLITICAMSLLGIILDYGDGLYRLILTSAIFIPIYLSTIWMFGLEKGLKNKLKTRFHS